MRGSVKILLAAMILVVVLVAVAEAQGIYQRPTVKDLKSGRIAVKFDKVIYYFMTPVEITVEFERIDDRYVELVIRFKEDPRVPYVEVSLWWDDYPTNTLILSMGGDNTWTLDSETGYAEK